MIALLRFVATRKWGLFRLALACALLWFFIADTGARIARMTLMALPDFDYAAEVESLRAQGRFGEALLVCEAWQAHGRAVGGGEAARAEAARQRVADEQSSWWRRAKDAGHGALTGTGTSVESLLGAIAADLFIVGDVRDLAIQGLHLAMDGSADPVIVALSSAGIVLTVAPEIDWGASVLKIARKSGAMTRTMADEIVGAVRRGGTRQIEALAGDAAGLARRASPGGAVRLLKLADEPKDVARLSEFLARNEKNAAGFLALHVTGAEGARLVKRAEAGTEAAVDALVTSAAKKGPAGTAFLRSSAARTLLRPHLVIGLTKGLWKGNVQRAVQRAVEMLSPNAWWLMPLIASWAALELALLWRPRGPARRAAPGQAAMVAGVPYA